MDRRYSQARFYNGSRAVTGDQERGDRLVRRYLEQARRTHAAAQSYGGSTGGQQSAGGNAGLVVLQERAAEARDRRAIFKEQGSGVLGARAALWQARQLPELPS